MKILIVEDNCDKLDDLKEVIAPFAETGQVSFVVAECLVEARKMLELQQFDLVILDQYLPMRKREDPLPDGAVRLLTDILTFDALKRPKQIFGFTAYDEVEGLGCTFSELAWYCCKYDPAGTWRSRLKSKLEYLVELEREEANAQNGFEVDVAIVTALHDPELRHVYNLPFDFKSRKILGDSTEYLVGGLTDVAGQPISVVALAVGEMGMAASSAACMKLIHAFRPRLIIMAGISGGVKSEVNLGDVLFAERCWNCEAGKLKDDGAGEVEFLPEPRQIPVDTSLTNIANRMASDPELARLLAASTHALSAKSAPRLKVGPTASNSAVVQSNNRIKDLIYQNRKLLGIEMETYGIYQACVAAKLPRPYFFSAKGVSDFADLKKNDKHRHIAALASAQFVQMFLKREFIEWRTRMGI